MQIKNFKIAIFGLGLEGVSAANFLGHDNEITVVEQKNKREVEDFVKEIKVAYEFVKQDKISKNQKFDLIVRSPGIRPDHSFIKDQESKGANITSGTRIFFDLCPCPIIGITGTKGKGTTATLIYEMLKAQKINAHLAGNIGLPALEILPKLTKESYAVLELSSFQLMDLGKSPKIAVVLMTTTEHLDWHVSEKEYQEAKSTIVRYQTKNDYAIINQDFESSKNFSKKTKAKVFFVSTKQETKGTFFKNGKLITNVDSKKEEIIAASEIALPGVHNLQNAAAAITTAKLLKVKNQNIIKVLKSFKGLKHRLQLVRELNGVKYYNDSFSTTPETTIAAIKSFSQPKVLVVGGSSKKSDFSELGREIAQDKSIKSLVTIGQEGPNILKSVLKFNQFKGKIIKWPKTMEQIVKSAQNEAKKDYVVLLSPACASFDMFKNYKDRGDQFIKEVRSL